MRVRKANPYHNPNPNQVRLRAVNLGLGRVPRDLILAEILPRALVAPRHYWRHLPDAAVRTDVFQPEP